MNRRAAILVVATAIFVVGFPAYAQVGFPGPPKPGPQLSNDPTFRPLYAGSPVCSESDKDMCYKGCSDVGPPYSGGNWFLSTACKRVDSPLAPQDPVKYGLSCTCTWYDPGWEVASFPPGCGGVETAMLLVIDGTESIPESLRDSPRAGG